jgi:hypothetical protein
MRRLAFRLQTSFVATGGQYTPWDFSPEICGFLETKGLSTFIYNERSIDCPDLAAATALCRFWPKKTAP